MTNVVKVDLQKIYFMRLFEGDIPLIKTYWIYFICVTNVLFRVAIASSSAMLYLLTAIYVLFISVAVWRSSNKYKGRNIWAILAKIIIVLNVIFSYFILFKCMFGRAYI